MANPLKSTSLLGSRLGRPMITEQQATIADASVAYTTGGLDTEAEIIAAINATNAKINAILVVLENHGLVADA
jgi:hypothetical protein